MGTSGQLARSIHAVVSGFPEMPMRVAAALIRVRQRSAFASRAALPGHWAEAEAAIHSIPGDAPCLQLLLDVWDGTAATRADAESLPF